MSQNKTPDTPEVSSARLVLTLAFAGLISGAAIIGIYEATLPTITINKARELREAVFKVVPGVTQMQQLVYRDGELISAVEIEKGEQPVYAAYDEEDVFVGYAIPAAGPGFQDTIGLLYGFKPDRQLVTGMEVLESRETPGLGDKIYKDADFVASFKELLIEPEIVVVKKGKKSRPNEVDAITGATISSKAVVRIINETHVEWSERLPPAGSEPPFVEIEPADTGEGQ
jgi:electron transport complex protein RnfG